MSWAIGLARGCARSLRCVPDVSHACPGRICIFSFLKIKKWNASRILVSKPYMAFRHIGEVLKGDTRNSDVSVLYEMILLMVKKFLRSPLQLIFWTAI